MNSLDLVTQALANDPLVSQAFRRLFANPPECFLTARHAKASARRFDDNASITGFGAHDFGAVLDDIREADADEAFAILQRGSDRCLEVMDEELAYQRDEERRDRIERGE